MALQLPDITLVAFDGTCPELTRLAIVDSLAQIEPAKTVIFSPEPIEVEGTRWTTVPKWSDRLGFLPVPLVRIALHRLDQVRPVHPLGCVGD